jgi:signal transduction histidine kinase/ActR/RegA family two-component response regulator
MQEASRAYQPGDVPLENILITDELAKRVSRQPNFQTEAEALRELAASLTASPDQILQKLSETVLKLCQAHSAGVSVVEPENGVFRWRAIAGELAKFLGGTMPRDFSPCGEVLDRAQPLLMQKPERFYPYITQLGVPIHEVLLMPFTQNGVISGTIWIIFHNDHRRFDQEDVRILSSVAHFAGAAMQSSVERNSALLAKQRAETVDLQLREFFMQAPTPMVILEGPQHRYTLANPPYEQMVNRSVLGKTVHECFTTEEVGDFIQRLDSVYQTGVPHISSPMPLEIYDANGEQIQRFLRVEYYPYRGPKGEVLGIFALHHDLTDQVKSQKVLERGRNAVLNERINFRNLFRQTPEMVCITGGPEHVFEFVNEAHIRALGFDATGMAVRQAQPESVEVHGILDSVYRTGVTAELKEIPVTVGDRLRHFNLTYAARRDENDSINGVMVLGIEITDQLRRQEELKAAKEEAEHANSLKSAFLANMSHEIRTPLGALIGFADLLREPSLSPAERSSYVDIMIRNGETLSVIINDILDLSKVEAGHMALEFERARPTELAAEVISLLNVKALEKNLKLTYEEDPSTPEIFGTDPARLKQILMNLIGNAIKFTPFGSVSVRSYGSVSDTGREFLSFEVRDTGIGIPSSQREKVFEMFVQADGSITRKFGGTGLGLALSRRLARALGGDVTIAKSAPGRGSVFQVTIADQTVATSGLAKRRPENTTGLSDENVLKGLKVLVVDDSPDNQDLIGHYLKRGGAVVDFADNGLSGYAKALANQYDVVLMDVQMPGMDGYTATHKLREAGYRMPIIALTAHVMSDVRQKCLNVGCSGYLPKPINAKELIAAIKRHAHGPQSHAELSSE